MPYSFMPGESFLPALLLGAIEKTFSRGTEIISSSHIIYYYVTRYQHEYILCVTYLNYNNNRTN